MMTPSQIKEYEFKSAGRNAYKADDVDDFLAEVTANYEKMFRENGELVKRVGLLADRLEQFKKEESDIKSAVISAQKAADMIIKEAEETAVASKSEAAAILSAAKGEAEIIKKDAEKQAIADSELLLSMTRDKAQEIIKKAKSDAGSILIEAKDSASDKVGEATRTVTSETILFDMLKKEVSEFKASILSQYKAHIELISKLPEVAAEEAKKQKEAEEAKETKEDNTAYISADENEQGRSYVEAVVAEESADAVTEIESYDDTPDDFSAEASNDENTYTPDENSSYNDESDFSGETAPAAEPVFFDAPVEDEPEESEPVVKTELPFDFFSGDSTLEFVDDDAAGDTPVDSADSQETAGHGFSVDIGHLNFTADDIADTTGEEESHDIPISKGFSIDKNVITDEELKAFEFKSIKKVDGFESIDVEDDADDKPRKKGFFKRK